MSGFLKGKAFPTSVMGGGAGPQTQGVIRSSYFAHYSAVTYSPEAQAFFDRLATDPTPARKAIYNTFIQALVYAGVWTKLDAMYLFAAADSATARTNLISASYGCTITGSPTFVADAGFTGTNAQTAYLESGYDISSAGGNYARNNSSLFVWKSADGAADNGGLTGTPDGTNYVFPRDSDDKFYSSSNNCGGNSGPGYGSALGLLGTSNYDSSHGFSILNGIPMIPNTGSTATPTPGQTLRFLATNGTGTSSQVAIGAFGSTLLTATASADIRNLYAASTNYLTSIAGGTSAPTLGFSSDIIHDGANNAQPGLCRLQDGRLFCCYSIGNGTGQHDSSLVYRTSTDNGKTWSGTTSFVTPAAAHTEVDGAVSVLANGKIIVSWMTEANDESTFQAKVILGTVAADLSISWGSPITVGTTTEATASNVKELANGQLMLGTYDASGNVYVRFSLDSGATWGARVNVFATPSGTLTCSESRYIQLSNGNILGFLRNDGSLNGYYTVTSTDSGATWSAPTQIFTGVQAAAPAWPDPVLLPSGHIFFIGRFTNAGGSNPDNQYGYSYSTDSGVTWAAVTIYYETQDYSYGSDIGNQSIYDASTNTIMSVLAPGTFNAAQIIFQQFNWS